MSGAPDRSERPGLSERISTNGWLMVAIEVLFLAVVFGWLFVTLAVAGGG